MKKLLIGIPAFDGIMTEAQESVLSMIFHIGRRMPDFDLLVHIGYKREQFRARNNIVDAAIANDCDYILMLDDDMVVPHNLVERLLAHDKDVVGALYYQRGGAYHPVIMQRKTKERGLHGASFIEQWDPMVTTDRGLHQVDVIGGGCMLFKTDVFRKILQPYFESERRIGTDLSICGRLGDEGVEIWVDTSIELGHIGERKVITSRSIPISDRTMSQVNEELGKDLEGYLGLHHEALLSAMDQASGKTARQDAWGDTNPDDYRSVAKYYQQNKDWHILNLAYFNLGKDDPFKNWALTEGMKLLNSESRVIDFGSGLGHISVPLARKCRVFAWDIVGSATQEFLEWRKDRHDLYQLEIRDVYNEFVGDNFKPDLNSYDGAFMISVMDHLPKPLETVDWVCAQIKPGGFFVCEFLLESGDDEPQHLNRYDTSRFQQFVKSLGFSVSPEHHWLFFKN